MLSAKKSDTFKHMPFYANYDRKSNLMARQLSTANTEEAIVIKTILAEIQENIRKMQC